MKTFFSYILNYFLIKSSIKKLVDENVHNHIRKKKTMQIIAESIIKKPVPAIRGIPLFIRYRKYGHIGCSGRKMFLKNIEEQKGNNNLYIFLSYCQKPLSCRAGRFADTCLAKNGICNEKCIANEIYAVNKNARIFFMTDDQSVAEMLVSLREENLLLKKRMFAVFAICSFSADLALFFAILGIEGLILRFDESNSCRGFLQYAYGDMGSKNAVTSIRKSDSGALTEILKSVSF